jgi:hypothetical protein
VVRVDGAATAGLCRIVLRPERVRLLDDGGTGSNLLPGVVRDRVYVGATSQLEVALDSGDLLHVVLANDGRAVPLPGETVTLSLPPEAIRVLAG